MTSSGSASKCPRCGSPEAGDDHRCDTDPEVGPETKHLEEQGSIPLMLTSPVSGSFAEHPTVPIDGHAQSARLAADLPTYDIRTPDRRPRSPAKQLGPLSGSKLRHFRLAELLGKGGMGFVYRAIDEKLHREVAFKVLPPDLASDPERRARLIVEARAAAAVTHANVAAVYEVEEDGDQVFIAMELVEGETLRERMAMGLTLQDAVGLALQIAKGISRAHEKGVLHRDLKPDNILVGSDGEVKILDFGLAKRVDVEDVARVIDGDAELTSGITQAGVVMGTPGYMSPEQILNDTIDHRSDIFALGVVLYEMVTQLHPFRGRVNEMLRNTLTVTPTAPSELNPSVSPELEAVIMGALARRRDDRTASARDIVRELTRIAGIGAPGSALLPSRKDAAQTTSRMSVQRPSSLLEGRVTLLASCIAEADQVAQRCGAHYTSVVTTYHAMLDASVRRSGGMIVDVAGERALAAFARAPDAFAAAVNAQQAFSEVAWPDGAHVRARIGLHTGEPKIAAGRYLGIECHRAVRVGDAAPGGCVLLTASTRSLLSAADLGSQTLRDLGPLRIKDLHYPERLFEASIEALSKPESTIKKPAGVWLTAESTPFIGRVGQIEAIVALVRDDRARLVTLTGPGGTGKTRLSVEVARALLNDFPGGVMQVLLGSVSDPSLVPATIAEALGITEIPGQPILEALARGIGSSRMLLVLDNFEQIVGAAPMVGDLLARCPSLVLMVTSREVLKIAAEREHVVPPLDVPGGAPDAAALASCEAAALFAARVRAVRPDFTITDENASIVASVCEKLEGIPLAIELAASRMKVLTLPALYKRLTDRFGFLKGTDRDRAERHQTLRAAIDWSYNLLDEPQRRLLCRAAVFRGGFFLESAEEVAGDRGFDVLDGLSALVDKSLLIRREVDGEMRLSALDTIRDYALERLDATGEASAIRARHAEHFAALVHELAPGSMGRDFRRSAGRLFTEADNVRAALGFALDAGAHALAAKMLRSLIWFWCTYSKLEEGYAWAKRALDKMSDRTSAERGAALEVAAWLCMLLGDFDAVIAHGNEGVALWRTRGQPEEAVVTMIPLGLATAATGAFPEGVAMTEEAKDACRRRGNHYGAALALNVLGELSRATGDYESAERSYGEALGLLDRVGNVTTKSLFSINVAYCRMHKGDWRGAAEAVIPTLELSLEFNNAYNIAFYLAVMACIAAVRGQHADGLRLFGAANAALRSIGATVQPADQSEIDRYVAMARAALGEAESKAVEAEGEQMTLQRAITISIGLRE